MVYRSPEPNGPSTGPMATGDPRLLGREAACFCYCQQIQPRGRNVSEAFWTSGRVLEKRLTLVLLLATLIAAFGSSFQYGYNVAAVNSPAELMKAFYNETYYERNDNYVNEFSLTLLWSVSVSMFPFGGFIGSLMVGPLVNELGRKGTLLFNNIFSIVPAILMGCSEVARSFEMIIVSRLRVGICAGLSSNVVPMYLGELAPQNLRGALGVVPQVFITVGILVAQIFGLRSLLANKEGWPILPGLAGVPAALQLLFFLPFFPESPRDLLVQKKDEVAARNALRRLRGWDDVGSEMEEIWQEHEAEKAAGFMSVLKLFGMRSLRWQVISIIILVGGQQLSGVNAIYYYADQIYLSAGVNDHDVQYVTVGTGAVNVLMTICAMSPTVFVVEPSGWRVLHLLGSAVCFTASCVLTAALALQDTISWMPYVGIACIVSYVVGHALGPSTSHPALLITEIFLQSCRPSAFMVGGSVHWLSNFTVGLIFPFIQVGPGPYTFIIFAVICLLTTIYIFLVVPETKAKTFMEINQIFTKMNKVPEVHPEKEELKDFPVSASGHNSSRGAC
ncbi:LOW QUALITY PROTEIN: solute carrier family 2, facilitated glucose transporter member 5 [Eumetopias jubatus]|uniref:LOW QUALITY PROTEIN: solute carrier family 2, facilitated glucose transporter member 5 n=1 Tax=Eumetopias jubatus TaxID=34886 RepID=UPI00101722BC|nr:LOW QUALITY PROTEIN: solute carrier family 2, facilitated glucose transporter member 5 [Eumetopias jubatus]